MPQSLSNILVHIIFSTKERFPFLKDPALRAQLHSYSRRWSRSKTTSGVRIDIIDAFRSKTSSGNFFAGIKSISMNGTCGTN
jgi:hypothetical protein